MSKSNRAAGEGSVFKLPSKKYRAQFRYRDAAGKRKTITKTVRTKTEAVEELGKLREKAMRLMGTLSDQTVAEYLDAWHEMRTDKGLIRAKTAESEARHVKRIKEILGREKVERLERRHVFELLDRLDAGPLSGKTRSVQQVHATLRRALKDAVSRGRLAYNPASEIEHPALRTKKRPERRSFSPEEMRSILEAVDRPRKKDTAPDLSFACLIHLLAHSGLRIGEALSLSWKDVDFTAGSVRVKSTLVEAAGKVERGDPKTFAGARTVHLPASVMERLRVQRSTTGTVFRVNGFVFSSAKGGPLRMSNLLRRRWHPLLKELELEPCGFHSLRHSHASMLVTRAKIDPVTVAERLGHADPGMTLRVYSHADEQRSSEAASAFGDAIAADESKAKDETAQ